MTTSNATLNLAIGCYNESIAAIVSFGALFSDTSLHDHEETGTCHLDDLTDEDKNSIFARLMHRVETFVNLMPADQLPDDETVRLLHAKPEAMHSIDLSRDNILPVKLTLQERAGVYETLLDITADDMQEMNSPIFDGVDITSLPQGEAVQRIADYCASHPADVVWMDFLANGYEMLNYALSMTSLIIGGRAGLMGEEAPRD